MRGTGSSTGTWDFFSPREQQDYLETLRWVVVSASQKTRNLQHPQPRVSLILLQATLNKVDGRWQVSDIGPKTGTQAPDARAIPPGP